VAYFHEFRAECYSPFRKAETGDLGSVEDVLRLIKKVRPSVITVSEARQAALRNEPSRVARFLRTLRSMGYDIKHRLLFRNDEQAEKVLAIYKEYHNKIVYPTRIDLQDPERYIRTIGEETRRYFSSIRSRDPPTGS